jgi:hypothetical protein
MFFQVLKKTDDNPSIQLLQARDPIFDIFVTLGNTRFQGQIQELQSRGDATLFEARSLGDALKPPMGLGRSPCRGPGGKAPESS